MRRRSRRQALVECEKMWRILARTGDTNKYKALLSMGFREDNFPTHGCFACEYCVTHKEDYCRDNCIMAEVWGGGSCSDMKSPYSKWSYAGTDKTRKKYAKIIADGCLKLIAEL